MEDNHLQIQQEKLSQSKKRIFKLVAIFSSIGLVLFLLLAFTIPFQDNIFQVLFPREQSGATTDPTM